jgi:hypothetical protein
VERVLIAFALQQIIQKAGAQQLVGSKHRARKNQGSEARKRLPIEKPAGADS